MKKLIVAIALALPMAIGAATADAGTSKRSSDCAKAKKRGKACVMSFVGDELEGSRKVPNGDRFTGRKEVKFGSLLKPRLHWHDHIVSSVNRL